MHRACIPEDLAVADSSTPSDLQSSCALVRELLLVELVCRTLKNVLREYQRRWMRSEVSTSDAVSVLLLPYIKV
jgi:hypothetical protein